ncbi:hypothetical protein [Methyloversatilis thermotolerans]|uniref:hypothetical protein n=1 Tax=Methyloversatilis thermotolerans TaxID=1346290 RepID=UPI0018DEE55E|nr:hypothetical protein [Methyloversatilis thermotolerans]
MKDRIRNHLFGSLLVLAVSAGSACAESDVGEVRPRWSRPLSLGVLAEVRQVSQAVVDAHNGDIDEEAISTGFSELNQLIRDARAVRSDRHIRGVRGSASEMELESAQRGASSSVTKRQHGEQLKERAHKWAAAVRSKAAFLESSVSTHSGEATRSVSESMRIQRAEVFRRIAEALEKSTLEDMQTEEVPDLDELELSRFEFPNYRFQDPTPTMSIPSFRDASSGAE